ncbi:MFS transporter [Nocardioides sp. CBS4Y-1]|uniref:MFS transporter n=2 Tax=Nocardioides acrostichi TaxID=2784339 RepID=A0A930YA96_9ACTN|nr:MFS transporter [Nocardioides acrostichi]
MIAIPLLVLATTGSAARTGMVAAAELVPLVLFKIVAGPAIDSLGPRRVALTCDTLSVVAVAAVPLLHTAGLLSFGALLALVALAGALRGPGDAAKHAMIPSVVAAARVPMEQVTGLYSAVERTASMLGAALAGVLVLALGPADALLVDAASFGIGVLVLGLGTRRLARVGDAGEEPADALGYRVRLREGWRFLRTDRLLMGIAVMVALTNMLDLAWSAVLMPVWAVDSGHGAGALGLLFAVWGGCSALGSLVAAKWGDRLPRFRVYLVAFLVTGLPRYAVLALGAPWVVVLGAFVVGGAASGFLNPILGAVELERIPPALVGRVTALVSAMAWGLMPLGSLLGGVATQAWGFAATTLATGLVYFVVTTAPALDPAFRQMDGARGA